MRFDGIQAYHGLLQHIRVQTDRQEAVAAIAAQAKAVVEALQAAGIECELVTGAGTGRCSPALVLGFFFACSCSRQTYVPHPLKSPRKEQEF